MKTTGKYTIKPYQCRTCGREEEHGSNHWGDIYPYCRTCNNITVWECLEEIPEGYTTPPPWKIVKLGDIAEIKKGK